MTGRRPAAPSVPELHLPSGSAGDGGDPLHITPERAGWRFVGLRVVRLEPGASRSFSVGNEEYLVLPLAGGCELWIDEQRFVLEGRESVFAGVTDFAYVPVGSTMRLTSRDGGTFALPSSRAERRYPAAYGGADAVPVEVRGAGAATRQLHNFFAPGIMEAHRLVAVEVITPGGNTSSYPPHKHDRAVPGGEAELEEIYYFRFGAPSAFGFHRTYAADGSFDVSACVRDGDAFLVPRGYHGPCAAMPGYDMYYLNVLAGPGETRSLAFSDDPAHAWVRPSWTTQPRDPRLPLTPRRKESA